MNYLNEIQQEMPACNNQVFVRARIEFLTYSGKESGAERWDVKNLQIIQKNIRPFSSRRDKMLVEIEMTPHPAVPSGTECDCL